MVYDLVHDINIVLLMLCTAAETFSIGTRKVDSGNGVLGLKESGTDHSNEQIGLNPFHEDISCNSIQNRLQYLESELSSALQTLRSNAQKILSQNVSNTIFVLKASLL